MDDRKYLFVAKEFLTTLIEKGTDRYGKKETPVFCLCLDPETYTPPRAPEKIDREYAIGFEYLYRDFGFYWKSHLHGSNLIYDQGTIRALYAASEMTSDRRYRDAADAYLEFFLDNLVSEQTGIFGWGEHIFYNVFLDYLIGGCFQTSGWHYFYYGHELERWTTIYDILWEKDPEKTRTEIEAIYDFKIHDYDTFICNRHSQYYSGRSDDVYTFIKHTGLFAHAFALAHAKTDDPKYLVWAKKMSDVFWNIRNPETNLVRHCVQEHWGGPKTCSGGGLGELSLFLMRAYQWSPDPEFLEKAHAYLKAYSRYFRVGENLFRAEVNCDGTDARPGEFAEYWEGPIRCAKAAALAYSLTRDPEMFELADVVVRAVTPEMEFDSVVERSLVSDAIEARSAILSTTLDLYELTGDKDYLAKAQAFADDAIVRFFRNGLFVSGLSFDLHARPRKPETYVYDARAGAGWLALNFLRLQRDLDATRAGTFTKFDQLERIYD